MDSCLCLKLNRQQIYSEANTVGTSGWLASSSGYKLTCSFETYSLNNPNNGLLVRHVILHPPHSEGGQTGETGRFARFKKKQLQTSLCCPTS